MIDKVCLNGGRIARLTSRAGEQRGEFRKRCGLSSSTGAKIFSGRPVSVRTAKRVAAALGVDFRSLLGRDGAAASAAGSCAVNQA